MQSVCNAGVLQAMQKHFKAPPQAVLDAWRPDALLDARDCDEAYLLQGPRPDAAHKLLTPPPQLQQAVCFSDISLSLCCASVLLHRCIFVVWTAGHADMHFALLVLSGGTRASCAPHNIVSWSLLCFVAPVVLNISLKSAHLSCFCLVFMGLSSHAARM